MNIEYKISENFLEKCKILALLSALFAILYNACLHFLLDIDVCKGLLISGKYSNDIIWQPDMCMIHQYSNKEALNCMQYISYFGEENYFVFIGDSNTKLFFDTFKSKLTSMVSFTSKINDKQEFSNIFVRSEKINLKMDFYWNSISDLNLVDLFSKFLLKDHSPKLIVFEISSSNKQSSNSSFNEIEGDKLTKVINKLSNFSRILWIAKNINDESIDNKYWFQKNFNAFTLLKNIMLKSRAIFWRSYYQVENLFDNQISNSKSIFFNVNVNNLLNYICNDVMSSFDASCCVSKSKPSYLQIILLAFSFTMIIIFSASISLFYVVKIEYFSKFNFSNYENHQLYKLFVTLFRLSLILIYIYFCDRSDFFSKENKSYTHISFFAPIIYAIILMIFFSTTSKEVHILNRQQTDEIKGFMQIVILIYHYTGASQILPIYVQMRIFVSMYFFLSAFGHITYLIKTGDYSLRRFIKVILRLNLFVLILSAIMDRPYNFYYFVPLVSISYIVVYFIVATPPNLYKQTGNFLKLFIFGYKFFVISMVISLLHLSNELFEYLFMYFPLNFIFTFDEESFSEWAFRWSLDRYTFIYGSLFALSLIVYQKFFSSNNNNEIEEDDNENIFSKGKFFNLAGPFALIVMYTVTNLSSKQKYNSLHPLLNIIPILGYIYLRNSNKYLRSHYSYLMASVGQISLELFLCQYHIWLSKDTHGILVLFPYLPSFFNIIVTTYIFIVVSYELHDIINNIINFLI